MITIRKSGTEGHAWEARCTDHPRTEDWVGEELYANAHVGIVAFNTQGIGNRTWGLAALAAKDHWRSHHTA